PQHRLEPFLDQLPPGPLHGGDAGVQRRGDPAVAPAFARIRHVRLQQDARLRQQLSGTLAFADQRVEPIAFLHVEPDHVFLDGDLFPGPSLAPTLADQILDLCDLYAFQSPTDPSRTVIILNANPNADALHPDAIYRLNIDNDGDLLTVIALSYVFSKPQNGKQTFNVFLAKGAEPRSVEAVGKKIVADAEVSFGPKPNLVKAG